MDISKHNTWMVLGNTHSLLSPSPIHTPPPPQIKIKMYQGSFNFSWDYVLGAKTHTQGSLIVSHLASCNLLSTGTQWELWREAHKGLSMKKNKIDNKGSMKPPCIVGIRAFGTQSRDQRLEAIAIGARQRSLVEATENLRVAFGNVAMKAHQTRT
jgi:hypothetical protein